jgi:uncharacterized membrane protein
MAKKQKTSSSANDKSNEKICAILSYLLIGLIWYMVDEKVRKSSFVKYHVKQGLVLLIVDVIYSIILGIIAVPLMIISLGMFAPILYLLYYVPLIWAVIGIINAANDKEKELPLIGKFAEKFNF